MTQPIDTLKKALEDKVVEELPLISTDYIRELKQTLSNYPDAQFFSEWKHEPPRYEYRAHNAQVGAELKTLNAQGIGSNFPKLTGIYSREEIEKIVND